MWELPIKDKTFWWPSEPRARTAWAQKKRSQVDGTQEFRRRAVIGFEIPVTRARVWNKVGKHRWHRHQQWSQKAGFEAMFTLHMSQQSSGRSFPRETTSLSNASQFTLTNMKYPCFCNSLIQELHQRLYNIFDHMCTCRSSWVIFTLRHRCLYFSPLVFCFVAGWTSLHSAEEHLRGICGRYQFCFTKTWVGWVAFFQLSGTPSSALVSRVSPRISVSTPGQNANETPNWSPDSFHTK